MTLVQRSRFGAWLKNLTGFRGPYAVDLDHGITPVYDLSSQRPELDEETGFWYSGTTTVAAVALNFSQVQAMLVAGLPANTRAVIDGVLIRSQAVATAINMGITGPIAAPTDSAMILANEFLNNRGPTYSIAQEQLGAVLNRRANNSAVSLFAGLAAALVIDLPANGPAIILSQKQGTLPGFVISPGWAFSVESGVVNTRIDVSFWGRYTADQL